MNDNFLAKVKTSSIFNLVDMYLSNSNATERMLLLDQIEALNPTGFEAWESSDMNDSEIKSYLL